MKKGLQKLEDTRTTFTATFKRYGKKTNYKGYPETTILLTDVKLDGNTVADHVWFTMTKGFEKLGELKEGTVLQFDARVKRYVKGYKGFREDAFLENPPREDFKLSYPTKIKVLE